MTNPQRGHWPGDLPALIPPAKWGRQHRWVGVLHGKETEDGASEIVHRLRQGPPRLPLAIEVRILGVLLPDPQQRGVPGYVDTAGVATVHRPQKEIRRTSGELTVAPAQVANHLNALAQRDAPGAVAVGRDESNDASPAVVSLGAK